MQRNVKQVKVRKSCCLDRFLQWRKWMLHCQPYSNAKNLKTLSLARNNIKSLTGLEAVGDTLEELWISYNNIEKLKGINVLKKLKVLYIKHNNVKDMAEFSKLSDLPCITDLDFIGNPLADSLSEQGPEHYTDTIIKKLPKLKRLDGFTVIREVDDEDEG